MPLILSQERTVGIEAEIVKRSLSTYQAINFKAGAEFAIESGLSNEWISTKDEIPESNEHVLCITNDCFNRMVEHSWSKGCCQDAEWFRNGFTHWKKLPIKPTK